MWPSIHKKNINLNYGNYLEKVFTEMSYHLRRFMAFRANDGCYGHIHFIVSSKDLILYTNVHLGMADNVAEESLFFFE